MTSLIDFIGSPFGLCTAPDRCSSSAWSATAGPAPDLRLVFLAYYGLLQLGEAFAGDTPARPSGPARPASPTGSWPTSRLGDRGSSGFHLLLILYN